MIDAANLKKGATIDNIAGTYGDNKLLAYVFNASSTSSRPFNIFRFWDDGTVRMYATYKDSSISVPMEDGTYFFVAKNFAPGAGKITLAGTEYQVNGASLPTSLVTGTLTVSNSNLVVRKPSDSGHIAVAIMAHSPF